MYSILRLINRKFAFFLLLCVLYENQRRWGALAHLVQYITLKFCRLGLRQAEMKGFLFNFVFVCSVLLFPTIGVSNFIAPNPFSVYISVYAYCLAHMTLAYDYLCDDFSAIELIKITETKHFYIPFIECILSICVRFHLGNKHFTWLFFGRNCFIFCLTSIQYIII